MQALQSADLSRYPDNELMRELDVAIRRNEFTAELHIASTLLSGSGFENLRKFLVQENVPDVGLVRCLPFSTVRAITPFTSFSL